MKTHFEPFSFKQIKIIETWERNCVFQRVKFVPTFISTLFFVLILKVEAREQHEPNNVATAQVTVTLLDENDNIPKFTSGVYEGKVFANQTEGLLLVQVSEFYSIRHITVCVFFLITSVYSFACIAFNHTNSEKYFLQLKKIITFSWHY